MKFELFITSGPEDKRKYATVRGFARLEDACAAAVGLLAVYRDEHDAVSIRLAGGRSKSPEHLTAVSCKWNEPLARVLDQARRRLASKLAERKENKKRMDWLRIKEAADKTFSVRLFALAPADGSGGRLYANPAALAAFFKNDFAAVEKILAETPAAAHAMA